MASTIQVDKITDIGGNTIISSNGSGTFTSNLPASAPNVSTATGTLPIANGGTGAATFAAAGLDNTPSFSVTNGSNTNVVASTWVKLAFNTEYYDTNSAFASDKFTVPASNAGKYYFGYTTRIQNIDDQEYAAIKLYKNGSALDTERAMGMNYSSKAVQGINVSCFYIDEAAVSDYYEVYAYHTSGSAQYAEPGATVFFGYKLLGV